MTKSTSTETTAKFDFTPKAVKELPPEVGKRQQSGDKLPFDWQLNADTATKSPAFTDVPLAFWKGRAGVDQTKLSAKHCRERLQRSFYSWKKPGDNKKPSAEALASRKAREKFSIGFADQYKGQGDDREYIGTHMYVSVKSPI